MPVEEALASARAVGITRLVTVGVDVASSRWAAATAAAHPEVIAAVAVHPNESADSADLDRDLVAIAELAELPQVRAVGESGLDYYRTGEGGRAQQEESFRRHIRLAKAVGKALVIHDRAAHSDVLRVLDDEGAPDTVLMHCFSGDAAFARECVTRGYVLSYAGNVTFKSAEELRAALAVTPLEHVLVEDGRAVPHPGAAPRPAQRSRSDPVHAPNDGGRQGRHGRGVSGCGECQRDPGLRRLVSLLSPADTRALAHSLGVAPIKSRGQNFLIDPNTVRRVVKLAELSTADGGGAAFGEHVLEIGPGLGSLTLGLIDAGARVTAVEVDPVLARALPRTVGQRTEAGEDQLKVLIGDALTSTVPGEPEVLAANLPYNLAVPILLTLLERVPSLRHGVVMVQAEVAHRLAAPAGSRVYGVPSAKLAWYASARVAAPVPRTVFWPQPRVDSALLTWRRRTVPAGDRRQTFAVVDAAFAQRRKMLRSALTRWAGSAPDAERILVAAGIDPALRGEQLTIGDFAAIAAARRRAGGG